MALAYRLGARLRDLDSFQYHPTGIAHPRHLAGGLISETARSVGALLLNGMGERFIDELAPRDVVTAAILRECAEGRGIERDGQLGVFLDTPRLIAAQPDCLVTQLASLAHLAKKCGIDPSLEPLLIYPTLHYQNGGVVIDGDGASSVAGLYCVGELSGGIHGRNRLMGNALLDILAFGRRAGKTSCLDRTIGSEPGTRRASACRHRSCAPLATRDGRGRIGHGAAGAAPVPQYGHFQLRRKSAA